MRTYLTLVESVLREGGYKPNRTAVDTISTFHYEYEVDLAEGFPLLTTKAMYWDSLLYEFFWYLSGQEHIRELREQTSIWDQWADEEGRLETAYGRFWRRYPIPPEEDRLPGEAWPDADHPCVTDEGTFDQLAYVLRKLRDEPHSRRIVVSAWHPANAAVSKLPPCHYTYTFNVQGDRLNLKLEQRSADVAVGVPFNIAAYSLLLLVIARETGFEPGTFAHSLTDAHIYCGKGDRGAWYGDNLEAFRSRLAEASESDDYRAVRRWIEREAPAEPADERGYDHVPQLLTQLTRAPRERPTVRIVDKQLDELGPADVELEGYDPHPRIRFAVAE
ncbi:MAG: thymidylate synthase [Halobacteriales archaeon]